MKKYSILSIMFIMLIALSTQAQKLNIGIKAGTDINKISGKPFSQEFAYGYQAGVFAQIDVTKKIGIQPEILFSQEFADTAQNIKEVMDFNNIKNAKLSYIRIPVLLNFSPNPFVSFQVGPQFGRLLNKDQNIADNGNAIFKEGDVSVVGGLQLNISKFRAYGRYSTSLQNINGSGTDESFKAKNFQLGVGLTF